MIKITMKSIIVFFIALLSYSSLQAQIEVGITKKDNTKSNLSQTQLIRLKNNTLEVIVPSSLKDCVETSLQNYWTFSDWKIFTDPSRNITPNDSVNTFSVIIESGPTPQTPKISMQLHMKDFNGDIVQVAKIILYPTAELIEQIQSINSTDMQRNKIFEGGNFYNMKKAFFSANLRAINDQLAKGKSLWLSNEHISQTHISLLNSSSLAIPEYVFLKRNMLNGKDEPVDETKLMKNYASSWEKAEGSDARFLMLYAQSGACTYLSIFDTLSGQIIYQKQSMNKYKLTSKDFKQLSKFIG